MYQVNINQLSQAVVALRRMPITKKNPTMCMYSTLLCSMYPLFDSLCADTSAVHKRESAPTCRYHTLPTRALDA